MTEGKSPFPPSLGRIVSKYDRDCNPRPEDDVKAELAERTASEARRKKNGYARNSHWSIRRMFHAKEIGGFRTTLVELLGEEEALAIQRGMAWPGGNSRIAPSMVLQRARARRALTEVVKGRGRPRTPEQRLAAMMLSAEAYMGAGLRRERALNRAGDKWGNTSGRFCDVFKETKMPHDGGSELLRAFFCKIKIEEVDQFIARFRASEVEAE